MFNLSKPRGKQKLYCGLFLAKDIEPILYCTFHKIKKIRQFSIKDSSEPEDMCISIMQIRTEMPLGFQIWVGKHKCGGHNLPPWVGIGLTKLPNSGCNNLYVGQMHSQIFKPSDIPALCILQLLFRSNFPLFY